MKLKELKDRLKSVPDDAVVCIAEFEEAFGTTLADIEVVESARVRENADDETEDIELENGEDTVVVLRW